MHNVQKELLKKLILSELKQLSKDEYFTAYQLKKHYGMETSNQADHILFHLERTGVLSKHGIEVAYYTPQGKKKTKIYIKK